MVVRINLAVGTYRILDLAGSLVVYIELRIALQISAAKNDGIYRILIGTTYADDILDTFVSGSMLFNVNGNIQVFTKYIMSIC